MLSSANRVSFYSQFSDPFGLYFGIWCENASNFIFFHMIIQLSSAISLKNKSKKTLSPLVIRDFWRFTATLLNPYSLSYLNRCFS